LKILHPVCKLMGDCIRNPVPTNSGDCDPILLREKLAVAAIHLCVHVNVRLMFVGDVVVPNKVFDYVLEGDFKLFFCGFLHFSILLVFCLSVFYFNIYGVSTPFKPQNNKKRNIAILLQHLPYSTNSHYTLTRARLYIKHAKIEWIA